MESVTTTIIVALLSSGALSALIAGLFQIWQTKQSKKDGLESKVDTLVADQDKIIKAQHRHEMDILRVELKLMISDFPDQESDILRIAEHYFTDGGNWVMSSTFLAWLQQRNLPTPPWFRNE